MILPEGVLAYALLTCANLSSEQEQLARATCKDLTYNDMKKQIERIYTNPVQKADRDIEPFYGYDFQECLRKKKKDKLADGCLLLCHFMYKSMNP